MSDPHQRRPFQSEARRLAARTLAEWEETEGDDLASSGESLDRLELRISHALEEIAETAATAPVSGDARGQLGRRSDGSLHVRLDALPGFHFILAGNEPVECALLPALDEFLRLFLTAATDKARREALLACFETTLPKEDEAWSREALNVMSIIRDRIGALAPQNPGDAATESE